MKYSKDLIAKIDTLHSRLVSIYERLQDNDMSDDEIRNESNYPKLIEHLDQLNGMRMILGNYINEHLEDIEKSYIANYKINSTQKHY